MSRPGGFQQVLRVENVEISQHSEAARIWVSRPIARGGSAEPRAIGREAEQGRKS